MVEKNDTDTLYEDAQEYIDGTENRQFVCVA